MPWCPSGVSSNIMLMRNGFLCHGLWVNRIFFFFLRDFIFKKTLFEKLKYLVCNWFGFCYLLERSTVNELFFNKVQDMILILNFNLLQYLFFSLLLKRSKVSVFIRVCTNNSNINGTSKCFYLFISKLHSIFAILNLLAHNNITISYSLFASKFASAKIERGFEMR